jgi:hypothetical protein
MPITHTYVSSAPAVSGKVDSSAWKAAHTVSITNADVAANAAIAESKLSLNHETHAAVTISTANGLSLVGQALSLTLASAGVTGALSGTDWSTFNSKQAALGYTPLNAASNLSDVAAVATARSNLGLVAGGTGDIWVEKAGDTMTGNLSFTGARYVGFDTANSYVGYPGVLAQAFIPHDDNFFAFINSLSNIYFNIDSGAGGAAKTLIIGKGRTGATGGTTLFQFGSSGSVGIFLANSYFGYPDSVYQGFTPYDDAFNFIFNSLTNHYINMDTDNNSTTAKVVFGKDAATAAGVTEVASIKEDGTFAIMTGGIITIAGTQVVGARVVDARIDDAISSGDATTDGVIDAIRDAMIAHGLMAAA